MTSTPAAPIPVFTCQGDQVFPLLADPANYVACHWDLRAHDTGRDYWLALFREHFPSLAAEAVREAGQRGEDTGALSRRLADAQTRFFAYLDELAADPGRYGRLDIMSICIRREQEMRRAGVDDAYRLAKERENQVSLRLLPQLLAELDATPEPQRAQRLIEGVFAGNIFDFGATSTAKLFQDGPVDFHAVRRKLAPRPWLIDGLDAWLERWASPRRHRQALLFVDNAGSDVILGMIPLARELLRRGTQVILAANSMPSLNDVTLDELTALIDTIAAWDPTIAAARQEKRLELISSGNGLPLIDLKKISRELVDAVHRTKPDLVVLEGMGRGIESNLDARLTCDAIKIAMIKDRGVADNLGGKLYDLVMRFDPS